MSPPVELSTRSLALLVLAALVIWFANLDYRKLIKPDEGRYAEISREMAVSGDWVTPRLNGIKYFEKPPLHYWAGAAAITLFGAKEWAVRLWSALTGLVGLTVAWYTGNRLIGAPAGLLCAAILGSSLMYVAVSHLNSPDMGLTAFLFAALCAFLLAQRDEASPAENTIWMHVAWAAMAAATLTKGLIGLVIPGATLVLYALAQRDWRLWRRLHLVSGTLLFIAIAAPWFVLVSMRNPEFAWFFFVHEHYLRYTTQIHQRGEPWYYFVPLLLAGSLPWTVVMGDALRNAWRVDAGRRFQARRFLLLWCVFVFVFFSVSGSKLPAYILPLFPALAILTAEHATTLTARRLAWQLTPIAIIAAGTLAALPFVHGSGDTPTELIANFKPWIAAAALAMLAALSLTALLCRGRKALPALLATAAGGLIAVQLVMTGHEALSPSMSAYRMAQAVKPMLQAGVPFYSVDMYDQTLDFYLGRTVTLVQFRDELDFGLQQEPRLALPDVGAWTAVWRRERFAFAIMEKAAYERFAAVGLPMQLIAHDHLRYIVKTP